MTDRSARAGRGIQCNTPIHETPGVGTSVTKILQNLPNARCVAPSGNLELEDDMRAMFFQAAESARVGYPARVQATHEPNPIEKKILLASRTATRAKPPAKALILALTLSIVVVALNSVQPANAQNTGRERNLRECNLAETRDRPDADDKGKTGSRELRYKACMTERGEIEF